MFGLGVAGVVFQTKGVAYVSPILSDLPSSDIRGAIAGTSSAVFDGLSDATRLLVVQAITRAIDKVYILVIATGALTFVLACLLPVSDSPSARAVASIMIIRMLTNRKLTEKKTLRCSTGLNQHVKRQRREVNPLRPVVWWDRNSD